MATQATSGELVRPGRRTRALLKCGIGLAAAAIVASLLASAIDRVWDAADRAQ